MRRTCALNIDIYRPADQLTYCGPIGPERTTQPAC